MSQRTSILQPLVILIGLVLCACSGNSGSQTTGQDAGFRITCTGLDTLDAEFVRADKTAENGYTITVRFINKGDQDIRSLHTACDLYEGDWKIRTWGVQQTGAPNLVSAGQSAEVKWVTGVSSSIDRIAINVYRSE